MPNTFTLIASSTVGAGGASSIDFTSIPSTYTDLVVKGSLRCGRAVVGTTAAMKINSSSTSYSGKGMQGTGSSADSSNTGTTAVTNFVIPGANATSNTFSNFEFYIPNYAGSTNKSLSIDSVMENNATESYMNLVAVLWSNTSAITSISFTEPNGPSNFVQYSNIYLYGVKNS